MNSPRHGAGSRACCDLFPQLVPTSAFVNTLTPFPPASTSLNSYHRSRYSYYTSASLLSVFSSTLGSILYSFSIFPTSSLLIFFIDIQHRLVFPRSKCLLLFIYFTLFVCLFIYLFDYFFSFIRSFIRSYICLSIYLLI